MMLEDDIAEQIEWRKDQTLLSELEKEYEAWETGKDKGYTLTDIKAEIAARKAKKRGR
jgi:hypothetical protein